MKKLPFILLLILFARLNAQTSIEGVGKFKIGKTTGAIVNQLQEELHSPQIFEIKTDVAEKKVENDKSVGANSIIVLLVPDTNNYMNGPFHASLCPHVKVYLIPHYEIASMAFDNLRLTFYDDVLVEIDAKGSKDILDAMKTKYGEVKADYTHETKNCSMEDETIIYEWQGTEANAFDEIVSWYNDSCEKKMLHLFYVVKPGYSEILRKCDTAAKDAQKNKTAGEKKKKLSEF